MKGEFDVGSAATDEILRWLYAQQGVKRGVQLRERVSVAFSELERRGVVHPIARDIEAVALRDEETGSNDLWQIYLNPDLFASVVDALALPALVDRVTKVVGVEARGFPLAGAVALRLGAGIVPVRRAGGYLPRPLRHVVADADYSGNRRELVIQRDALRKRDRVLIVDDWAETGSHLRAVLQLIEASQATVVGVSLIVDQLQHEVRSHLPNVRALMRYLPGRD